MACCNNCDKLKACAGFDTAADSPFIDLSYDTLKTSMSRAVNDEFMVRVLGRAAVAPSVTATPPTHTVAVALVSDKDGLRTLRFSLVPIPAVVPVPAP